MIPHGDPRFNPMLCRLCGKDEFAHDRGAYGRCFALTPSEYERVAILMAGGLRVSVAIR